MSSHQDQKQCPGCKNWFDPLEAHDCPGIGKAVAAAEPRCHHCGGRQGHHLLTCQINPVAMGECDYNPDPDPWPGKMVSVPDLRQKTSAERKAEPIHSAPMKYHPDALAAHARLCVSGNIKHNGPDAPLHWARGKSVDHLDCAARHMLTPDAIDPETGETELTAAFWRLGCALQLQQERLLKEKGIMPYSGITP